MNNAEFLSGNSLARRLRLQQLMIFVKVIECGSVLAASRELAMTQSAISKSIQELENQLGASIFTRGKKGMRLTEFGAVFENHAKLMLAQLRYLAEDLNSWKSGATGQVIVGTLIAASANLLPRAIAQLRRISPNVAVTVRVGSNATLYPMLSRGEIDIVLGILPEDASKFIREKHDRSLMKHVALYEEGMHVVVGNKSPQANQADISLLQLHSLEWIIPTRESETYHAVQNFFWDEGLSIPEKIVESVSILTNLELIMESGMVSIMPKSVAQHFEKSGLIKILRFEKLNAVNNVGYTVRAEIEPSIAAQNFINALHEVTPLLN